MSSIDNTVFATSAIVIVGRWASSEPLNVKIVTGGLFLALVLTAVSNVNEGFARIFADFLLVGAIFTYGYPISELVAITTGAVKKTAAPKATVISV